jgi:hypothetical protein
MRTSIGLGLVVTLATFAGGATSVAQEATAVIELFTSQGCSSCPPADRLAGELVGDEKLIVLSLPVDYWDYLGWHDTLALHSHTQRQKAYAAVRGDRQVYTPQMVIDGIAQRVGSERGSIERALVESKGNLAVSVRIERKGGNLEIDIGGGIGTPAGVWLLAVVRSKTVAIGRGENRGKTITYNNVVRTWQRLGAWSGGALHHTVPVAAIADADADQVVVIVQSGSTEAPGPIYGAAKIALR